MTRTTRSPAAPSAVSRRTSLVTRSLAVAEPHLGGVVEQQAELRAVGGDVDRLHPTAHGTGETLDQLGSRAVPDRCVLAGLAIDRVGTGDQHVGDRLTGDHVEHPPVAVDAPGTARRDPRTSRARPARGSRSSRRAGSRCAPGPGRPTGSPPARARLPACRPPARACRRGRRRRPGGGRGRCTRCPDAHLIGLDREQRRAQHGQPGADDGEHEHGQEDPPEAAPALGPAHRDAPIAQARLDAPPQPTAVLGRLGDDDVVVDEHHRPIARRVGATEITLDVHRVGWELVVGDRDHVGRRRDRQLRRRGVVSELRCRRTGIPAVGRRSRRR